MVTTISLKEALNSLNLPELDRNLFSSPDWFAVIQKTYGLHLHVKYIKREGRVDSYIVYSVVRNFLEWKICILSYCDYSDYPVKNAEDWHLLFEDIRREYPEYRIAVRNLYDASARECHDFKVLSKEVHHSIDISGSKDAEELWSKVHRTFKNACNRAKNNNITVKRCGRDDLGKFYDLHLNLRKNKYRLFPQPYNFFENIWDQYMENGKGILLGAFDGNRKLIAANIYLICGKTLFYKFSASRQQTLKVKPNNLVMWEGIKFAKERGLDYVDLGSSGIEQEGLIWFKMHICEGTVQRDITHLGFAPEDYKYSNKVILNVWTKFCTHPLMPKFMVNFGSRVIYPFLA